ncbi:MAG: hypothetical protein K1X72_02175 [Pyrinomonadaceae bacterium]|nr:hypothetical protein [Pyrinomonadaceae bacterium]
MPDDYIPSDDQSFIEFLFNFIGKIDGNEEFYGLTAEEFADLKTGKDTFVASYSQSAADKIKASTSAQKKNDDRKMIEGKTRSLIQRIQKSPNVTDTHRADLRITIRSTTRTPASVPSSRPIVEVDTSHPLRHTVNFYDNVLPGKAKPAGVKGAEVWVKIGGEPTLNEEDYRYLATDTATPYLAVHKPENVGKQAHYLLRWVNSKGEAGAWSNVVSATITG